MVRLGFEPPHPVGLFWVLCRTESKKRHGPAWGSFRSCSCAPRGTPLVNKAVWDQRQKTTAWEMSAEEGRGEIAASRRAAGLIAPLVLGLINGGLDGGQSAAHTEGFGAGAAAPCPGRMFGAIGVLVWGSCLTPASSRGSQALGCFSPSPGRGWNLKCAGQEKLKADPWLGAEGTKQHGSWDGDGMGMGLWWDTSPIPFCCKQCPSTGGPPGTCPMSWLPTPFPGCPGVPTALQPWGPPPEPLGSFCGISQLCVYIPTVPGVLPAIPPPPPRWPCFCSAKADGSHHLPSAERF